MPGGDCWGGYVFLLGQKQEAALTWFGIFTDHGESSAVRDVMHELWKGTPPTERAPDIATLTSDSAKKELAAGSEFTADAQASDPDGDALSWHWTVTTEKADRDAHGKERLTAPMPEFIVKSEGGHATFRAPKKPGEYRVHLRVTDTHQRAATANFPFKVIVP